MKKINYHYRINQNWTNYPAEKEITVDDKLYEILTIIQENKRLDEDSRNGCIYYRKTGVMSQDTGFGWIDLESKEHGKGIGMFYGGISKGTKYVDLTMLKLDGENHYENLIKER